MAKTATDVKLGFDFQLEKATIFFVFIKKCLENEIGKNVSCNSKRIFFLVMQTPTAFFLASFFIDIVMVFSKVCVLLHSHMIRTYEDFEP